MRLLSHIALSESLLHSGLARGRIDVEALAQVLLSFHRPAEPLHQTRLHLQALLWALHELPLELMANDTVWVSDKHDDAFSRIGPSEWACAGGYARLRRVALALGALVAASRQLRALDEDTLGALAYRNEGYVDALALALDLEPDALHAAAEQMPKLFERLAVLAQHAFLPTLRTRGIEAGPRPDRAAELWRELLQSLSTLDADHRPLIVWVGPLWVTDLVSPYTREVQPLLARWAREQAGLPRLADAIAQGDVDATYLCANLFDDPEVIAEREGADASVGIFTIADPNGVRMAKVIDCARLEVGLVDPRLGLDALEAPAPIVIVLNGADPDVGYSLTRLLCDVSASYRGISVCMGGLLAPGLDTYVATSRMAQTAQGAMIFAAPGSGMPAVRPLGLPDLAYLRLFGERSDGDDPWHDGDHDSVFETLRAAQDSVGEALWRGDLAAIPIVQRFWLEPDDDAAVLDAKRAHIADALSQWRAFFGLADGQPEPAPQAPKNKPIKPGSLRFRA